MSKRLIFTIFVVIVCVFGLPFAFYAGKWEGKSGNNSGKNEPRSVKQEIQYLTAQMGMFLGDIISDSEQPEETVPNDEPVTSKYFLHKNITSTVFWVGEKASDANNEISNSPSAWDENWKKHFGGTDTSQKRNGFFPAAFVPKENPFYVALPFNDFDSKGRRKTDLQKMIPWAGIKKYADNESMCKNRWVKIVKGGKTAFAQWEDVGPFKENDSAYVFGAAVPASKTNKNSGIDVSPAVRDYLGLEGIDKVDWQFVDSGEVPDGPWKNIVTVSQIDWN
jgi:hypothetical protein